MAPFPWPAPPQPSVMAQIPPDRLFGADTKAKTLMDVGRRLSASIAEAGYLQRNYLGAGCNGFAIVLDLEHIQTDGSRKPGNSGFGPSSQDEAFSLTNYLKRLFYAPPGYYRQIVFVVSDEGIANPGAAPTEGALRRIAREGSSDLPPAFAAVPLTWKVKILALVYEFEKGASEGDAKVIAPMGRLAATVHLRKAKLY